MNKMLRAAIFGLIPLAVPMVSVRQSRAQISRSTPAKENEDRIREWLSSAGLAKTFYVIRIGDGPHPDPQYAFDGMIQHLELRFVTATSDQGQEAARFSKILADYQEAHASALSGKLLREFIDAFALEPRNACVDLHLYDTTYCIYFSRADGSLVVSKGGNRAAAYDPFSVTIPALAPQEQFRTRLGQSPPSPKAVGDAVERFLRAYLGSVQSKGGPKPEILTDVHRQDGYLRLLVNGARGMVTDGYWEWLDIAVFFHQRQAAEKGNDSQWDFVCNVEVKYASSPREPHPTDADSDYARQLARFRTQLGAQLQASLEKGIHD